MSAPPAPGDRELLATRSGISTVVRVFRAPDAIEVDESEGVDVIRRRILLDEILMITRHRERGTAFVVTTAALGIAFGGLAALVSLGGEADAALVIFAFFALPLLIALVWRLAFGVDVVTVFGRRSRIALRFSPVRGRGPVVYGRLCRLARSAQRRAAPRSGATETTAPGAAGA